MRMRDINGSNEDYQMNFINAIYKWRCLLKNQWISRNRLEALQLEKLKCLLKHAYEFVPYYQSLFKSIGFVPENIHTLQDLSKIPVTRKEELLKLNAKHIQNRKYINKKLTAERTSGSTGHPFTTYYDSHFKTIRNLLFLRALQSIGYRFGHRVLLITDLRNKERRKTIPGWYYTSILNSPSRLCDDLNRIRPHILYGPRTLLWLMAEQYLGSEVRLFSPQCVVSTAETMDLTARKLIKAAFNTELFDFYGLTEMGIVGWECEKHRGYHLAEDTTFVEYLPCPGMTNSYRLVMTNLHQYVIPLIRYETGDIVSAPDTNACGCGRTFSKISRIHGRLTDSILLKSGAKLSPYHLTCSMEEFLGLNQYQIIQEALDRFVVKIKAGRGVDRPQLSQNIRSLLKSLIGSDINVVVEYFNKDIFNSVRKFRIVSSII